MTALSSLHATRNAAGLTQDDARPIYLRIVEKSSTRAMTDNELYKCRQEIIRLYPSTDNRHSKGSQQRLKGKYAAKFQALWIAAWNLGLVRDRRDSALIKFVKRQTGIDHTAWLHDVGDMDKVVEALKGWMAREADVDWKSPGSHAFPYEKQDGYRIACAQWLALRQLGKYHDAEFYYVVCNLIKIDQWPEFFESKQWIVVMNALGKELREAQK